MKIKIGIFTTFVLVVALSASLIWQNFYFQNKESKNQVNQSSANVVPIILDASGQTFPLELGPVKLPEGKPTEVSRKEPIQESIVRKADSVIVARVGEDVFNNFFTFDDGNSIYNPSKQHCIQTTSAYECRANWSTNYELAYVFTPTQEPLFRKVINVVLDNNGNVVQSTVSNVLPDCKQNPKECEDFITQNKANSLAKDAALALWIENTSGFPTYNAERGTFVWIFSAITQHGKTSATYNKIVLDAQDGQVLSNTLVTGYPPEYFQ